MKSCKMCMICVPQEHKRRVQQDYSMQLSINRRILCLHRWKYRLSTTVPASLTVHVSVWRVWISFLRARWHQRQKPDGGSAQAENTEESECMTRQSCDWLQMQIQQQEAKKHSLQPLNEQRKKNQTGSWATRAGELFKRYPNIRATEGPPNISQGPLRSSNKDIHRLELFN